VAKVIRKYSFIKFITCSNSLGNGLWIDSDTESVVIKPKNGFGGVGGKAMKATTLANVHKFYQLLGNSVDIIGCGGVTSGKDVFELILCGAKCVQIGTQLMENGVGVFEDYLVQLKTIMKEKGYKTIEDFRGKLKYI
jgi:dihydroorotate dehydrogenase (fumarate)